MKLLALVFVGKMTGTCYFFIVLHHLFGYIGNNGLWSGFKNEFVADDGLHLIFCFLALILEFGHDD